MLLVDLVVEFPHFAILIGADLVNVDTLAREPLWQEALANAVSPRLVRLLQLKLLIIPQCLMVVHL